MYTYILPDDWLLLFVLEFDRPRPELNIQYLRSTKSRSANIANRLAVALQCLVTLSSRLWANKICGTQFLQLLSLRSSTNPCQMRATLWLWMKYHVQRSPYACRRMMKTNVCVVSLLFDRSWYELLHKSTADSQQITYTTTTTTDLIRTRWWHDICDIIIYSDLAATAPRPAFTYHFSNVSLSVSITCSATE